MNQSKQLFGYQQKPKQVRFRTNHDKDKSKALRKQLLLWLFTNRNNKFRQADISNKCTELNICRNLHYYIHKSNIIIKDSNNNYNWNPEITSPDFSKLVDNFIQTERKERAIRKAKRKLLLPDNNKTLQQLEFYSVGKNQISEINQKLDLICKALGLC